MLLKNINNSMNENKTVLDTFWQIIKKYDRIFN